MLARDVRRARARAGGGAFRKVAEWRANKLTASEYDETTWSARTYMAFMTQRLSVAVQYSLGRTGGGRCARPVRVGGGRPTSGALDVLRGVHDRWGVPRVAWVSSQI